MLNNVRDFLHASPAFREAFDARENGIAALYDMAEGQRPFYAALLSAESGRPILYIAPSDAAAMRAADDCAAWLGGGTAVLPVPDLSFTRGTASRETAFQRLSILQRVRRGEIKVLCVSAEGLLTRMMLPAKYEEHAVCLRPGSKMEPGELVARLVKMGYERVDMVEGRGQCALRGDIVDAFSPAENGATRIEFWDDEVDSLRLFDPISQRSLDNAEEAVFYPAVEWLLPVSCASSIRALVREQMKRLPDHLLNADLPPLPEDEGESREEKNAAPVPARRVYDTGVGRLLQDADHLDAGLQPPTLALWAGAMNADCAWLWEYLDDPILVIEEPERVKARCEDRLAGFREDFKLTLERQEAVPEQENLLFTWEDAASAMQGRPIHLLMEFLRGMGEMKPTRISRFAGINAPKYVSRFRELGGDLKAWETEGYLVLLMAGGEARAHRLQTALTEMDAPVPSWEEGMAVGAGDAVIWPRTFSHGFTLPDCKLAVIADSDLFGAGYRKTRKRQTAGERIEAFTDLKEGDYVVHEAHGVGIFKGTVRLQSEGTYRDYLLIQYQGSDKLYVPTDQFDRVQKYIGGQDNPPPLNSLSGSDWEKKKNKVKAGLKKLAFDLVKLYADRQSIPGHAFCPDTPWQREFEDAFPYELTPDQDKAVEDIRRDMERPSNMDRLVCGDVGYGKTEVALRAAMKAVMDGKQVALLAPTTILAQQHYYTMLKRFAHFPVEIDVLSRFRSPKLQKETLRKAAEGKVDILVGTHRLLSKDVHFKDLGLLIVDEEQRFGVAHKESIKNMKNQVDVLTLSATPIPRTLHMSMVGVRDMSLLQTPPDERYPVQTYVLDYNDAVIRDAIMRELNRQGQVYFLYNQVRHIDQFAARLRALVPEARIAVAHGQMKESLLEDVMLDFYEGRFDVLLCSTIIENGLDVPTANTIIIFDADHFGLSQLYQLRGRVGRSSRVAYAYFTVRPDKMLSETAQKRLSAIREFTEFGSGFRIAMRDLEIRGAGNIFGPEQSGQVAQVGYDMYCRLIEEAVREARGAQGEPVPYQTETRVEVRVDAYLPAEYVRGDTQRMEIFKRIAMIKTRETREDVIEEMIDRFGDIPDCVMNLIDIAHLRGICGRLGVNRVSYTANTLVCRLDPNAPLDPARLYAAMEKTDKRLLLSASREPAILLRDPKLTVEELLRAAVPILEKTEAAMGEEN
ncbi:MAG: transcription-repair coupling factor [Clostridia bacterium]|nr:transcription-repair coupling factor [Clostridia bacterium]